MKKWNYIAGSGERGPVSSDELRSLFEAGKVNYETSIWSDGMSSWEPLSFHRHLVRKPLNSLNRNSQGQSVDEDSPQTRTKAKVEPENTSAPYREVSHSVASRKDSLRVARGWILAITVLAIVGMLLYPPFQIVFNGSIRNMGYGFLFSPPSLGNFTASIAVQILSIQMLVVLIVGGAAWYLSGYIPPGTQDEPKGRTDGRVFKYVQNAILFLTAGMIALVIFGALMIGLSVLVQYFSNQGMLEARLFFDSYLKLNALVFFSAWAWFGGRFLSKERPKRWGRIGLWIYLGAPIISYLFSFSVTSSS